MTTPGGMDPLFDVPETTTQTNTAGGSTRRTKGSRSRATTTVIPDPAAIFRVHLAGADEGVFGAGPAGAQNLAETVQGFDTMLSKTDAMVTAAAEMVQQQHLMIQMQKEYMGNWDSYQKMTTSAQVETFQQVQRLAQQLVNALDSATWGGGPAPGGTGSPTPGGAGGGPSPAPRANPLAPGGGGLGPFGPHGSAVGDLRRQINLQVATMQPGSLRGLSQHIFLDRAVDFDERFARRLAGDPARASSDFDVVGERWRDVRAQMSDELRAQREMEFRGGYQGPLDPREQAMLEDQIANEERSMLRTARQAYTTGKVTQGYMRGGAKGAMRSIPGVGWGFMAGEIGVGIGNQVAEQRAANAQFQQIYGGTNMEGMWERGRGQLFRAGQFGVMQGEQADALFAAASRLGLDGDTRRGVLDFAAGQYRERGMDVEDSMAIAEIAVQNGNQSLLGLSEALDTVSNAARRSGMSVHQATKAFTEQYRTVSTIITGAGAGGAQVAANMTAQVLSGGRATSQVDVSGMMGTNQRYLQAALVGSTPGRLAALATTDPVAYAAAQDAAVGSTIRNALPSHIVESLRPMVERFQEENGGGPLTSEQLEILSSELSKRGGLDYPEALQQMLSQQGIDMPLSQVGGYALNYATGQTFQRAAEQTRREGAMREVTEDDIASATNREQSWSNWFGSDMEIVGGAEFGGKKGYAAIHQAGGKTSSISAVAPWSNDDARNDALDIYGRVVGQTGRINPALQQLLSKDTFDEDQKYRVAVKGKGGRTEYREVGHRDLIRHFGDQAAAGTVQFAGGDQDGVTFAEAGMAVDQELANKGLSGLTSYSKENNRGKGEKYDGEKGPGRGQTVRIEASEELQRWLRIADGYGYDNAEWVGAAANGQTTTAPRPK